MKLLERSHGIVQVFIQLPVNLKVDAVPHDEQRGARYRQRDQQRRE
jgi:hypothetical protein